jgi:hypothetical protein
MNRDIRMRRFTEERARGMERRGRVAGRDWSQVGASKVKKEIFR